MQQALTNVRGRISKTLEDLELEAKLERAAVLAADANSIVYDVSLAASAGAVVGLVVASVASIIPFTRPIAGKLGVVAGLGSTAAFGYEQHQRSKAVKDVKAAKAALAKIAAEAHLAMAAVVDEIEAADAAGNGTDPTQN